MNVRTIPPFCTISYGHPETGTDMLTGEPSDRRVLFAKAYQLCEGIPAPPRLNFYAPQLL